MKYLLYCIFRAPPSIDSGMVTGSDPQTIHPLKGVYDHPVRYVSQGRLCAAVSELPASDQTPDISGLMAYEQVIEAIHRDRTIIPMRYGGLFEETSRIRRLLEGKAQRYETLLGELDGSVEMGIRVLLPNCDGAIPKTRKNDRRAKNLNPESDDGGKAYLAARRAHYGSKDRTASEFQRIVRVCREAFSCHFVKCRTEYPPHPGDLRPFRISIPSLYYLVPKRSVSPFREIFQRIDGKEPVKLLLSGPWPPYNFVLT